LTIRNRHTIDEHPKLLRFARIEHQPISGRDTPNLARSEYAVDDHLLRVNHPDSNPDTIATTNARLKRNAIRQNRIQNRCAARHTLGARLRLRGYRSEIFAGRAIIRYFNQICRAHNFSRGAGFGNNHKPRRHIRHLSRTRLAMAGLIHDQINKKQAGRRQ